MNDVDTRSTFSIWSRPVLGWAMYDFANTIFSFAVITLYFNEWVIEDHGRPDWNVSVMGLCVALALVLVMPAAGAVSDAFGRRLPFLAVFTAGCVAATAALGFVSSVTVALMVAGIAIFCYQLSLSMYDPLLARVAPLEHRGTVSGLGVGFGYVGVLVGSTALGLIVGDGDKQHAFVPTAILFAVFALPIFLFVREPRTAPRDESMRLHQVARHSVLQVAYTARTIAREHRPVGRFLIARFLYVDAIATVIAYMTVYMDRLGGFSAGDRQLVLAIAMVCAAIGGFVAGRLVERHGPKRVLQGILALAVATLATAGISGSATLVWVLGPSVGVTLGAVWTSDRVLMMRLTPPRARGEFFGIYNLVGKLSNGIGPLVLWSGSLWLLHEHGSWSALAASRLALVLLACAVVAGMLVLRPLSDAGRFADRLPEDVDEVPA